MGEKVVVLASDWDGVVNPVPYYTTDPDGCLDFNSSKAKSRSVLSEQSRKTLNDCARAVSYNVVICQVTR
jgi:hypothetical protein